MTRGLVRFQHSRQTHFVTFSCYQRQPKLSSAANSNLLLKIIENTRQRFGFRVYGYVLMPEHVHLLISEPETGTLADALHSLKASSAKQIHAVTREAGAFWQKRYYDRNLRSYSDFAEKLRYIHRNPVKRDLCEKPEDWAWSSFRHYAAGEIGTVEIESKWTARRRSGNEGLPFPG